MEFISRIKSEKGIVAILLIALFVRLLTLANYQNELTLYSDDARYVITGVEFLKSGFITYDGNTEPTVFMMPGMAIILAIIFKITGYTYLGLVLARIPFIIFGLLSIFGIYLICKKLFNKLVGLISSLIFALSFPHIVMDNLFLTESPFTCVLIYFVYWMIRYCDTRKNIDFIIMLSLFLAGLMLKPTIGALPIVFLPYYLAKKFPIKLLITRASFAFFILILFLMPWWVRNYQIVGEFLPFTGNQGDTKLLGTFQGIGYPEEDPNEISKMLNQKARNGEYEHRYFQFKEKGEIADERIKRWIQEKPLEFIYSYLIYKPVKILIDPYYPIKIFDIRGFIIKFFHLIILLMASVGVLHWLFTLKQKNSHHLSMLLIVLISIYFTYINSYYYALPRYAIYFLPFIFILSSYGFVTCMNALKIKKARLNNIQ